MILKNMGEENDRIHDVIVIGAGVAGKSYLSCSEENDI